VGVALESVLPNLKMGLENTGFIFGAGTSFEAGYPLISGLTTTVVDGLNTTERQTLDDVLGTAGKPYDSTKASPNMEEIADLVTEHSINSGSGSSSALVARLRALVTEAILGVTTPKLDHHMRFLKLLKQRAFGRAACIYIFTTNYDVLFELAGAESGVVVETGFIGSVERFFDHQRFSLACGALQPQSRFTEHPVLTVRLIKLHGSISWIARDGQVFERHPGAIAPSEKRVMVLPRRRKVIDTLMAPHDQLFGLTSRTIGTDCKYLATCGYSFGDDHINQDLLAPPLAGGKARVFAFCAEETKGMAPLRGLKTFSAGFQTGGIKEGIDHTDGTDCWKFSRFVDLFE
jgi:hypothetical protein